jgi:hypothetical protein
MLWCPLPLPMYLLSFNIWWMMSSVIFGWFCGLLYKRCHNLSLGLTTKTRACKGVGQEWSPRVTFHAPGSVGKCEGMNPHIPKWAPTLGVGVSMDSLIFRGRVVGVKSHWIERFLIPLESSWNLVVLNGLEWPIWVFKTQITAKRRHGNQTTNLIPDH